MAATTGLDARRIALAMVPAIDETAQRMRTALSGLRLLDPWLYVRPAAPLIALMLVSAMTEGFGLILLVPMLAALGDDGPGTGRIGGWIASSGLPMTLGPLLAIFTGLVVMRALVNHARSLAAQQFEVTLVDGLRARAWSALLHCDWRVLSAMRQSDNASLLISNIDRIGYGVNQAIAVLATAVTLTAGGLAALAISPQIAALVLAGGAGVLIAYRRLRRNAAALGERLSEAYQGIHARITEGLGALRVIKSFGQEERTAAELAAGFADLRAAQRAFLRDAGLGQVALQGGGALLLALGVWLAIDNWGAGPATILPLVALFVRALPLLGALQQGWQNWEHARPALAATLTLIAEAEAAREPATGNVPAPRLTGTLTMRSVTVRFTGRVRPALAQIDITIPARRITALVGPSGAGKSTLADLAGGLLAPDAGEVLIDGVSLDGALRRAWRTRVAYVQQEPVLFTGTIRDNLAWADRAVDDAAIRQALADASAQFVDALPEGLGTSVGDGGRQLSGGERQRIVLARALLRGPELLILDEATSALDAENERAIAEAVLRLRGRTTILIIGHRGTLSALADLIVTLEDGNLICCTPKVENPPREWL